MNMVAKLDAKTYIWTQSGTVNYPRYYPNVISVNSVFLVIGGNQATKLATEKCQLSDGTMSCSTQAPILENYYAWPELILIEDDFCQEIPSQ